jgi:HK97 gp10 family phage protein
LVGAEWEVAPETHVMIARVGEEVAQKAKDLAPVDTGALQASIAAHPGTSPIAEAQIIASVDYAAFVEFGTSRQAAQSYLRAALDAVVGR